MKKTSKKTGKVGTMIAFAITIAILVAACLVPMFDGKQLLFVIPEAVKAILGQANDFSMKIDSIVLFNFEINIAAWLITIFAGLSALLVLLFLICLFIKKVKAIRVMKSFLMVLDFIVAAGIIVFMFINRNVFTYPCFYIAAGGLALMLVWQSFENKASIAIFKVLLFLLSAAVALLIIRPDTVCKYFESIANVLQVREGALNVFTLKTENFLTAVMGLTSNFDLTVYGSLLNQIFVAISLVIGLVSLIVAALDLFVLVFGYKKSTYWFNFVRYGISFIGLLALVLAGLIQGLVTGRGSIVGLGVYLAAAVVLVQFLLTLITYPIYKRVAKTPIDAPINEEEDVEYDDEDEAMGAAATGTPSYGASPVDVVLIDTPAAANAAATEAPKPMTYVVKNVYSGPTDSFIDTLNTDEKIEFVKMFVENASNYPELPAYQFNADNKEFFSAIFLNLGKFRSLISDGLLRKIYNKLVG